MIDTARTGYPEDMVRLARGGDSSGAVEMFARDLLDSWKSFARDQPTAATLWALGIGFVLGWKLKPW